MLDAMRVAAVRFLSTYAHAAAIVTTEKMKKRKLCDVSVPKIGLCEPTG